MPPGSMIRTGAGCGGGHDFLAETGLDPVGEIVGMERLGGHYRIEIAADGWDLLQNRLGIRRLDSLQSE